MSAPSPNKIPNDPYLVTSRKFPVEDEKKLESTLNKMYFDIAYQINRLNKKPGTVVQSVMVTSNTATTTATQISAATTPQITDGLQILSLNITPTSPNNLLQFCVNPIIAGFDGAAAQAVIACLFQVGNSNALSTNTGLEMPVVTYQMAAGTILPSVFTVRVASNNVAPATVYINRTILGPSPSFGGTMFSSILVQEIQV